MRFFHYRQTCAFFTGDFHPPFPLLCVLWCPPWVIRSFIFVSARRAGNRSLAWPCMVLGFFCSIFRASQKGLLKVFFDSLRNCVAVKSQPWKSHFFRSGVWPLAFLPPTMCEHRSHGVVCCRRSSTLRIHCSHGVCVLGSPLSVRTIYAESFSICLLTQSRASLKPYSIAL